MQNSTHPAYDTRTGIVRGTSLSIFSDDYDERAAAEDALKLITIR